MSLNFDFWVPPYDYHPPLMKTWTPVLYVIKIKLKKCKHMHFVFLKVTSQFPNCALNALHVRLLRSPLMGQSVHFISVRSSLCIPTVSLTLKHTPLNATKTNKQTQYSSLMGQSVHTISVISSFYHDLYLG